MKASDLYDLPMRKVVMHADPARPAMLGLGVATKNGNDVQVLILTCKDSNTARNAYALLKAYLDQAPR